MRGCRSNQRSKGRRQFTDDTNMDGANADYRHRWTHIVLTASCTSRVGAKGTHQFFSHSKGGWWLPPQLRQHLSWRGRRLVRIPLAPDITSVNGRHREAPTKFRGVRARGLPLIDRYPLSNYHQMDTADPGRPVLTTLPGTARTANSRYRRPASCS